MSASEIRKARSKRERASARLDEAHAELIAATVWAVRREGMSVVSAAQHAGVSRQAVHDWLNTIG